MSDVKFWYRMVYLSDIFLHFQRAKDWLECPQSDKLSLIPPTHFMQPNVWLEDVLMIKKSRKKCKFFCKSHRLRNLSFVSVRDCFSLLMQLKAGHECFRDVCVSTLEVKHVFMPFTKTQETSFNRFLCNHERQINLNLLYRLFSFFSQRLKLVMGSNTFSLKNRRKNLQNLQCLQHLICLQVYGVLQNLQSIQWWRMGFIYRRKGLFS